ncbi:hypothetical protein PsAD13_01478 [Pseudovibrio sp. Ad13]|uniref:hypothetical protein n=1 Tax=unclassified Pseudovibrio TaxID=2627060 RepID=UPI0007AEC579|nr:MULTISPECIES: hypothetical protein [unclassified Pseudovibrio]KZK84944.1 hypothetical protein PsAD13_01478 [Pseudovibrio sp. Ad13]
MTLPSKEYFTLIEAGARWGAQLGTIAGWAEVGRFRIVTSTPHIACGDRRIFGMVELFGADLLRMLSTTGKRSRCCLVQRVIPFHQDCAELLYVTKPEQGLRVQPDELWIPAIDLYRFEEKYGLAQRAGKGGREPKYDWEGMWAPLCVHIFAEGVPATMQELANEVQAWFIEASPTGEAPDMSTIRRRIRPIWEALKKERED